MTEVEMIPHKNVFSLPFLLDDCCYTVVGESDRDLAYILIGDNPHFGLIYQYHTLFVDIYSITQTEP